VVPVGGAAPDDASVRPLAHPDAYPISFVTLRRLSTSRDRAVAPITAEFLKYLTAPGATASFRQPGMLLLKEAWPPMPDPQAEPKPNLRQRSRPRTDRVRDELHALRKRDPG